MAQKSRGVEQYLWTNYEPEVQKERLFLALRQAAESDE